MLVLGVIGVTDATRCSALVGSLLATDNEELGRSWFASLEDSRASKVSAETGVAGCTDREEDGDGEALSEVPCCLSRTSWSDHGSISPLLSAAGEVHSASRRGGKSSDQSGTRVASIFALSGLSLSLGGPLRS